MRGTQSTHNEASSTSADPGAPRQRPGVTLAAGPQDQAQRAAVLQAPPPPRGPARAHVKGVPQRPFWNKGGVETRAAGPAGSGSAKAAVEKEEVRNRIYIISFPD